MISYEIINSKLEQIHTKYHSFYWSHLTNNVPLECDPTQEEARAFFCDPAVNEFVRSKKEQAAGGHEKRKYRLLQALFVRKRIEYDPELSAMVAAAGNIMTHGALKVNGVTITVRELQERQREAKTADERKRCYNVWVQLYGPYKKCALDIISRRNFLARQEGYCSYPDLHFKHQELDADTVNDLISSAKDGLIRCYREEKQTTSGGSRTDDYNRRAAVFENYFKKDQVYRSLGHFLGRWGVSMDNPAITLKDDTDNPRYHSSNECIPVSIPDDIRIYVHGNKPLCEYYYTVFHEYAHALHMTNIRSAEYIGKITPTFYEEAMPALFDKLLSMPESLGQFIKNGDDIKAVASLNISGRWDIYMHYAIHLLFEVQLYARDMTVAEGDKYYDALTTDWYGKPQGGNWGGDIIGFAKYPLDGVNVLFAHAVSNQIIDSMRRKFGSYLQPEVYRYIVEHFFNKGNDLPWRDVIKQGCGEDFNSRYFNMTAECGSMSDPMPGQS
jgi:hypothetical protein